METGGTQERGPDEAGKVVRIPRDWFGPPDELVPFGPRAAESDEEDSERGRGGTLAAPLDPNSFWDESSSSIQDVVEAPAVRGVVAGRSPGFPARAYEVVRDRLRVREAVAGAVVAAIVGLSLVGWLAGQSPQHPPLAAVAAISGDQASQPLRWLESSATRRMSDRTSPHPTHKQHREVTPRHSQGVEVVYHPSQAQSVPSSATGVMNSGTGSSRTAASSGATEASAGAPSQSQPPAFGANSALGPISSPDG